MSTIPQTAIKPDNLDRLSQKLQPSSTSVFARHETFHPRFGWLKKGFDQASQDSGIFLREDAPVLLGWGKIWCDRFVTGVAHLKYWKMIPLQTLELSY
jgi:hypothetical protein